MTSHKDLNFNRYGRLIVVGLSEVRGLGLRYWKVLCDCGVEKVVYEGSLISGDTKSCGCLNRELVSIRFKTHGMRGAVIYKTWESMKARCYNPKTKGFKNYGGRGIKVCDRWVNSFENFYADMGKKPNGMTLDRIDTDGHYSPENCRWVTQRENANNRRKTVYLTYLGVKLPITVWADLCGLKAGCLRGRMDRGWSVCDALNTKSGYKRAKDL